MAAKQDACDVTAETGLVVGHFGVEVEVRFDGGERRRVRVKRRSGLVVGDRVRVSGATVETLPRASVLRRHNPRGRVLTIAANLDVLGVVVAPVPVSPPGFVERAIVAARATGIEPFLVVNKNDLPDAAELWRAIGEAIPGVEGFRVSAATGDGLDRLRAFFAPGRRGAFVGTSGVGKSHLLNALCPGAELDVGEINAASGLGRHVTTRSTLLELPDGGELIDTPGFRDFGPVAMQPTDLAAHFPGFAQALAAGCRYRDCLHRSEPDCGVLQALESGEIAAERHRTYLHLLAELEQREKDVRRY